MQINYLKKSCFTLLTLVLLLGLGGYSANVHAADKLIIDENSSFTEVQQVISKYLKVDNNGTVMFDLNQAEQDGQSEFIIESGKLVNQLNEEYKLSSNKIGVYKLKLPIWGNWCGPGHGGGEPKDVLDANCKIHDLDYKKYGYFDCGSDIRLVARINRDYDKMKFFEKQVATAVAVYFTAQYAANCT